MAVWPPSPGRTWIIDLDGVIWLAGQAIPGSSEGVEALRTSGSKVLFATNNAAPTVDELVARLDNVGITAAQEEIVTSAMELATMLEPGSTALAVADGGLLEALAMRGVTVVDDGPCDAVVVGWTHRFDFELLARASRTVRGGARLVGSNEDPTHPTPHGLEPGAGSILAAVATASGVDPEVAGKPHAPMAALLKARAPDAAVMVGDRPATDGRMAEALGVPYALVYSGVTAEGSAPSQPAHAASAADLGALVRAVLAST